MTIFLVVYTALVTTIVSGETVEATEDITKSLSNLLFEMDDLKGFDDEAKSEMFEMIDLMRKNINSFDTKFNVKNVASDQDESAISDTENMKTTDVTIIKNMLGMIGHILQIMKDKRMNAEKALNDIKMQVTEFESIVIPAVDKIRDQTDQIEVGNEHIRENLTATLDIHHNKVATDITKSIENHSSNLETKINMLVYTVSNATTDMADVCNDTFLNGFDIIDQNINLLKVNIDNVSSNVFSIRSSLGTGQTDINLMINDISQINKGFSSVENSFKDFKKSYETDRNTMATITATINTIYKEMGVMQINANLCCGDISKLRSRFSALESKFLDMEKYIKFVGSKIDSIGKTVKSSNGKTDAILNKVGALEGKMNFFTYIINFIQSNVSNIQEDINSVKDDIESTENAINLMEKNMKNVESMVKINVDKTTNIQTNMASIRTDVEKMQTDINSVSKKMVSIENGVNTDISKNEQILITVGEIKYTVTKMPVVTSGGNMSNLNKTVTEPPKPTDIPKPTDPPKPTYLPKPTDPPKPTYLPKPTNLPKPTDTPNPTNLPKPADPPKPINLPKPKDSPKPTDPPKPKTDGPSGGGKCDYSSFGSSHTMNLPSNKNCVYHKSGVSDVEIQTILQTHNELRAKVANGLETQGFPGPQPDATNMKEMSWNPLLAEVAQAWAEQCPNGHDSYRKICDPDYAVGQNIYWMWSFNPKSVWEDAIRGWYSEVKNMPASLVDSFGQPPNGKVIGHYTQVVWANSYEVGCGAIYYSSTRVSITFPQAKTYVCNYGPAGNFMNAPMYERGATASNCPDGTSSDYPGLCAAPPS